MSEELTPRAVERLLELGAPLAERPELGAVDGERYELGEVLGQGGMGVVYAAFDRELRRPVALKVLARPAGLSDAARARFLREAVAAARLVHPHIAAVYDATPEAIAMQRVQGRTLAEDPPRDARELAALVRDAALALHFAHGEGVVHRDLKPANLMVERPGRPHVYVMDFGLAKELSVDASLSASGSVVGTPAFMAPEQAAGRGAEVGPRTDVYGLGATLYACLAGRPPFADEDVVRLLRRVVEEEPRPLRELAPRVDRDLATIVGKAMAKEPARRYASALELAGDLDRWLRGEPVQARPPSLAYRLQRFLSRRQGQIAAGLAAAALALLIALPFLIQARARRAAAERERDVVGRVLALSQRVGDALRDARATRASGVGHQEGAYAILEAAIDDCRGFLARTPVAEVELFLGRLAHAQGRMDESLAAFDRASALAGERLLPSLRRERGLVLAALYRDAVPVLGEEPPPELETWRRRGREDLAAAAAVEPEVTTAEWLYAEALRDWLEGDVDDAVAGMRWVVEMDPVHQDAHLALARLYLLLDREALAFRHSVIASDLLRGWRPAYLAQAGMRGSDGEPIVPELELLALEGMRELLIDFNLLLQLEPGDANTFGLRGQVAARRALRAAARGDAAQAREQLEAAIADFGAALTISRDHTAARVDRAACRLQLARLLAASGEPGPAADALALAARDYDAALALEPGLAVARYDRALLHLHRAHLAQLARRPDEARAATARARDEARAALDATPADHPWRARFEELAEELE